MLERFMYTKEGVKNFDSLEELKKEFPEKSKTGYSCPSCDKSYDVPYDLKGQTPLEHGQESDINWWEGHECECGTKYHMKNGV